MRRVLVLLTQTGTHYWTNAHNSLQEPQLSVKALLYIKSNTNNLETASETLHFYLLRKKKLQIFYQDILYQLANEVKKTQNKAHILQKRLL